jgi:hypothetical protein
MNTDLTELLPSDLILRGLIANNSRAYTSLDPDDLIAIVHCMSAIPGWDATYSFAAIYTLDTDNVAADYMFAGQAQVSHAALQTLLEDTFADASVLARLSFEMGVTPVFGDIRIVRIDNFDRTEHYTPED